MAGIVAFIFFFIDWKYFVIIWFWILFFGYCFSIANSSTNSSCGVAQNPKNNCPARKISQKIKNFKIFPKIINKFPKIANNTFSIKQLAKKYLQIINLDNF